MLGSITAVNQKKPNMAEQTFYENGNIKVTSARIICGDKTFALAGVTSVRVVEVKPDRTSAIICMVAGLFCLLIPTIIGIIYWFKQKSRYEVWIESASGGRNTFCQSKDSKVIADIVTAINDAIVHRG